MHREPVITFLKNFAPAIIVLFLSIAYALAYGDLAPLSKSHVSAWMAPFRFLRFTTISCVSLLMLPGVYKHLVKKVSAVLVRIGEPEEQTIRSLKCWLLRPMQGIGIGLIFGTKLIVVLQLMSSGPSSSASALLSTGFFQYERLFTVTLTTVAVSLFLCVLWTFDDLGVRYYNRKDSELKMIGKYAGALLPFLFGMYGIFNLLANYSAIRALLLLIEIVVVLYPPFSVFTIIHAYYIRKKVTALSGLVGRTAGIVVS